MALFDITVIKNDTNTWLRTEVHNVSFISRLYSSMAICSVYTGHLRKNSL